MNIHQAWLKAFDGDTDKVMQNIRYAMLYSDNWDRLDAKEQARLGSVANALARILTMDRLEAHQSWSVIAVLSAEAAVRILPKAQVALGLEQAAKVLPKPLARAVRKEAKRHRQKP